MRRAGFATLLSFVACTAWAAKSSTPAPPPVDCHDATHRAVGFWVGHWKVSVAGSDTPVATSHIEWILGGCAIKESFAQTIGPGNKPVSYHGTSYTVYDGNYSIWRQLYVDDAGHASNLHGTVKDDAMVLATDGPSRIDRMTVSAQPDGSVRQHGQFSLDGGKSWQEGYDFIYHRVAND